MPKKEGEQMTGSKDEADMLPEPPPGRLSSSDVSGGAAAPRMARYGEGKEGQGARRERGVTGPRAGFFERLAQFWHDVRAELKRVSWPTAKEVKNTTIITIIAVIFFALYLYGVDQLLTFLVTQLERLFNWLL